MSKLYLVGTPIGNLGDFSSRAVETLRTVDFIAAEDTRVTLKLLNRFEISKPMVSYYQHNLRERGEQIVARILSGESCALVTDAGMPAISDPGEDLVRLCAEAGIEIVSVPGPSAATTALAMSGLNTSRFTFEGFISTNRQNRREHLESLAIERRTMIFYEAPHKLRTTLNDLAATFGQERRIALCRELTKLHEEVIRTTLGLAVARYAAPDSTAPRGEFVLVVEGAPEITTPAATLEQAVALAQALMAGGQGASAAAKQAAQQIGCKKSDIYRQLTQ
ncbi:16S rRNA (cytidine(1402)-2'-O)-methyltransferase [Oscillospiraceae bacterium LTW-04]|nr:16S rRNA (cytidine(1402)-2'-O)-methyltransferase [Oscillospiraceae bacterium MB24-C1]